MRIIGKIRIKRFLKESRNIYSSNIKHQYQEENKTNCMKIFFDFEKKCFSFPKKSEKWIKSCGNKSSAIKGWEWQKVNNSKIDREKCNDDTNHLYPCFVFYERNKCMPNSNRSWKHIFCILSFLWCCWRDKSVEHIRKKYESHNASIIGFFYSENYTFTKRKFFLKFFI